MARPYLLWQSIVLSARRILVGRFRPPWGEIAEQRCAIHGIEPRFGFRHVVLKNTSLSLKVAAFLFGGLHTPGTTLAWGEISSEGWQLYESTNHRFSAWTRQYGQDNPSHLVSEAEKQTRILTFCLFHAIAAEGVSRLRDLATLLVM